MFSYIAYLEYPKGQEDLDDDFPVEVHVMAENFLSAAKFIIGYAKSLETTVRSLIQEPGPAYIVYPKDEEQHSLKSFQLFCLYYIKFLIKNQ